MNTFFIADQLPEIEVFLMEEGREVKLGKVAWTEQDTVGRTTKVYVEPLPSTGVFYTERLF